MVLLIHAGILYIQRITTLLGGGSKQESDILWFAAFDQTGTFPGYFPGTTNNNFSDHLASFKEESISIVLDVISTSKEFFQR